MGWAHDVFVKMNEASAKRMRENEKIEQRVAERKLKMSGKSTSPMAGGMVASALINLINTSDLDQVMRECAPEQTNRLERIEFLVSSLMEQMADKQKFDELNGRYQELEKKYTALQDDYHELLKALPNSNIKSENT
ncbi:MAG: hypothetical protein PT949_09105 [Selenomonadales bacterium]|nr:hypothetical protein [Selenomonadales bacterium]MDD7764066.1 hypothetical protein [Selenomonadales bacterium]